MSRIRKKRYEKRVFSGVQGFLLLILLFVFLANFIMYLNYVVKPCVTSVAEIEVKAMVEQAVNDAIQEQFSQGKKNGQLLYIKMDDQGKVTMVQADTVAMNAVAADLTASIQRRLRNIKSVRVNLPIGSLLGSQILSQGGPKFDLTISPLAATKVDFKTEFKSSGINQTRHKVYLEVDSTAKILVPFASDELHMKNTVLIAETVIVGDVPESYIFVPKENILDVANE